MSAFTMEKIAVFAPMESASVRITVTVKPGLRNNWRVANLRFCPNASIDDPPGGQQGFLWGDCTYHTLTCQRRFRCRPGNMSSVRPNTTALKVTACFLSG